MLGCHIRDTLWQVITGSGGAPDDWRRREVAIVALGPALDAPWRLEGVTVPELPLRLGR